MGVFICWSGENSRSHQVAKILKERIPEILQNAEPFISGFDIGAGSPWMEELTKALKDKTFGILCITPENKDNPWIHFEAGALWKADEARRVCPLLFEIRPAEMTGPLSQLQSKELNEQGFLGLMKEVNQHGCSTIIDEELLRKAFKRVWQDVEADLSKIEKPPVRPDPPRDEKAMIEEILTIVRSLQRDEKRSKILDDAISRAVKSSAVAKPTYYAPSPSQGELRPTTTYLHTDENAEPKE
jgi:TIR domain